MSIRPDAPGKPVRSSVVEDRRASILEAAARCVARRGVRGLRIQDVAQEADVSPGLLYYYYTDRSGLLAATFAFINERAGVYTTEGIPPRDAVERLRRLILGELQDRPEVIENSSAWGELRASAIFEPALREPLSSATDEWVADVASAITEAQEQGKVPDAVDATAAAHRLTALVEGLSNRWLSKSTSLELAHELLDAAMRTELRIDAW